MKASLVETRSILRRRPTSAGRVCARPGDRRPDSIQRWVRFNVLLVLLSGIGGAPGLAEEVTKEQMQSLDEQVQVIKSDVLRIASELGQLEEKLLYPSHTQVGVFVSLADGEIFRLDSVQIQIDGEFVARHVYDFKELEALQKGGVQRIYTGNLPTGEHRLEVSVAGKRTSGGDFAGKQSFAFRKEATPKIVGITLADPGSGDVGIDIGPW